MKNLLLMFSLFFNFQMSLIAGPVFSKVPIVGKIANSVEEKDVIKIFVATTVCLGVILISVDSFDRDGFSSNYARRMRLGINIHDLKFLQKNNSSRQNCP